MTEFTILANDPSFTHWGWAIIQKDKIIDFGCIITEPNTKKLKIRKGDDDINRVFTIVTQLKTIIEQYQVSYIIVELPHGSQNASAMKSVGIIDGILPTLSTFTGIPLEWYSEADAKACLFGKHKVSKMETIQKIKELYSVSWTGFNSRDEHIADAIAVYHTAKKNSPTLRYVTTIS